MPIPRQTTRTVLRTGPSDGLYELVLAGAAAAGATSGGAVGIIELASSPEDEGPTLSIEAEFGYRDGKRVLGALEVRAKEKAPRGGGRSGAAAGILLRATLTRFGGKGVTNLWVGRGAAELADVTVSFGARVPFWAETVALFADSMSAEDAGRLTEIVGKLGVPVRQHGKTLVAPRRQLRARMTVDAQMAAYTAARAAGYDAALYTAAIPCTQATRIAESGAGDDATLDLVLSRGLTPSYTCTSVDAKAMEAHVATQLNAIFKDRAWTLTHSAREGTALEGLRPERGLKWFQKKRR